MGQRNKKRGRAKKPPPQAPALRTREQRQAEVRKIVDKLTELNLTTAHEPVVELMSVMCDYVNTGNECVVDIQFPALNRRIVGKLTAYVNEPVMVKLKATE
tara:strand:+ start:691 stop:993 length:303 start_codon:yes stop_codon:yes gene_type:complete